jgi:hypothetical protein
MPGVTKKQEWDMAGVHARLLVEDGGHDGERGAVGLRVPEGQVPRQQLVHQDAHRPLRQYNSTFAAFLTPILCGLFTLQQPCLPKCIVRMTRHELL